MSEKITKLVKELQEKNEELQKEMKNLSENNLSEEINYLKERIKQKKSSEVKE